MQLLLNHFQKIQKSKEFQADKKYYSSLLDTKSTAQVIERAEQLQKSLNKR